MVSYWLSGGRCRWAPGLSSRNTVNTTAGDDLRYLDWNIYARHGDLLLKRFQEEQDLHVYLMLDCSRSMSFGTPPKFDLARHLVAALAYIALAIWIAWPSLPMQTVYSPNCP